MGIQKRLARDRYGENYYNVPNLYELENFIEFDYNTLRNLHKHNVFKRVHDIYYLPPKGRWKQTYQSVIDDYAKEHGVNSRSWVYIVKLLYLRYHYFCKFPQYYNHNFHNYACAWYNASLFQMRKAILKQMWLRKEIPVLSDLNNLTSCMYYKLPKPMYYKHTIERAEKLYEIFAAIPHKSKSTLRRNP